MFSFLQEHSGLSKTSECVIYYHPLNQERRINHRWIKILDLCLFICNNKICTYYVWQNGQSLWNLRLNKKQTMIASIQKPFRAYEYFYISQTFVLIFKANILQDVAKAFPLWYICYLPTCPQYRTCMFARNVRCVPICFEE